MNNTPETKLKYTDNNVQCFRISETSSDYLFMNEGATIRILNLKESSRGLDAEMTIECPTNTPLISNIKFNLYNQDRRKKLALDLSGKDPQKYIDWDDILEYVIKDTIDYLRRPPELSNIDAEPDEMYVSYLLYPILPLNQPTTIFAQGGIGKSVIADYIAVLLTHGVASPVGFRPEQGETNVLYLDWETDDKTHQRYVKAIENGLEINKHKTIHYLNCRLPLSDYRDYIKTLIAQHKIELIIIDSQMAATADNPHGMTEAQIASEYYNNLREFGVTTLTIDHVTKQDMFNSNGTSSPYGSVVKTNRSRSQYEVRMDDGYEDTDHKEFALVHKKHNLTRKQQPLGISIDYENEGEKLISIKFDRCNIADNPELSKKVLSLPKRITNHLRNVGEGDISSIADALGEPDLHSKIGTTLAQRKDLFVRISEGLYGLRTKQI